MPHLIQKRPDKRHRIHFALGHKPVRNPQPHHHRQHIKIARVVRRVHFRPRRFHVLFAHHLQSDPRQRKQHLQRRRRKPSRRLLILDLPHYQPRRHNPQQKNHHKIHPVDLLKHLANSAPHSPHRFPQKRSRAESRNLHPRRSPPRRQRS